MSNINSMALFTSPSLGHVQVEARSQPRDSTPPPREKTQALVKASNVDQTMEIAFRTAENLGLAFPNVEAGGPEQARYATPENVYPIKIDFRPDNPDNTYSPERQEKINQFKERFHQELRHQGIDDIARDMFT